MLFACLTLMVALACAQQTELMPSDQAFAYCESIGRSTGCSGCSSPLTSCEWCAVNIDESYVSSSVSGCAPKGWCTELNWALTSLVSDIGAVPVTYEPANHLCPADPIGDTEPIFRGSQVDIKGEQRWTQSFSPQYCALPYDPYPVDRTVQFVGDSVRLCEKYNHQLFSDRNTIEDNCGSDLSMSLNQECLKLYESFACTISCPEYGQPARYDAICLADFSRLAQACQLPAATFSYDFNGKKRDVNQASLRPGPIPDDNSIGYHNFHAFSLGDCLDYYWPIPFTVADQGEDCYPITPDLIPASSKYEHDLCFFGDPSRCNSVDCKVAPLATWGSLAMCSDYYCYDSCGDYTSYGTSVTGSSPAHTCLWSYDDEGVGYADSFGLAFGLNITQVGSPDGRDCETAAVDYVTSQWGYDEYWATCDEGLGTCVAIVYVWIPYVPNLVAPTWCNSVTGAQDYTDQSIPANVYCVY